VRALDLKLFPLLDSLTPGERGELADVLEPLELEPGAIVFEEGDPAQGLLLLAEGRLRLRSDRAEEAGDLGPGAVLGTLAIVAGGVREATAEAASRCRLWLLRRDAFDRFVELSPRAACRLLQAILREYAALLRDLAGADG